MFDQMAALSLPVYGHPVVKAPHMARLAARGTLFENAYCTSPLCSPSRFAMLTGRLPSRIGAYDNATELPASVPTLLHHLRNAGYRTCLSGKMDFTGADQLHGYRGAADHRSVAVGFRLGAGLGASGRGAALVPHAAIGGGGGAVRSFAVAAI